MPTHPALSPDASVPTGFYLGELAVHQEFQGFASPLVNRMMDHDGDPYRYQDIRGGGLNDLGAILEGVDFELMARNHFAVSLVSRDEVDEPHAVSAAWFNEASFRKGSPHFGQKGLNIAVAVREDMAGQGLAIQTVAIGFVLNQMTNPNIAPDWIVNLTLRESNVSSFRLAHRVTGTEPTLTLIDTPVGPVRMASFRAPCETVSQRLQDILADRPNGPAVPSQRFHA